jgi:non-specific serine/threonine protein kinase
VTKGELLEAVWAGLVVEEANLTVQVSTLRKVLGSDVIATIPGRGYRFSAALDTAANGQPPASASTPTPLAAAPPAASASPREPAHAMVGRSADMAWLRDALAAAGTVVTLVGPAGVGKTTLARAQAAGWPGGAVWVDLAPLTEAPQVQRALARALDVPTPLPGDHGAAPLAQALGDRLLVLDNAEHLVDAVAAQLLALRQASPALRVLCTCQLSLGVAGERVLRLEPLALPQTGAAPGAAPAAALVLFTERARAADHRFDPAQAHEPLLLAICQQLDGLPLALEMAAARVPALGLKGLHDALQQRFSVLTRGLRTAAERHRTLHTALDWSHGLLNAEEQRLFRALGVFAGGFTLDLAVAVGAGLGQDRWAVVDTLSALVDRSLVATDAGDPPRYRLLETMRAYALEHLHQAGEGPALQLRHAQAVQALFATASAQQADEALRATALAEHDNAREAMAWATQHAPALAVRMAAQITLVTTYASWRAEALQWLEHCEPALAHGGVTDADRVAWWNERARQLLIGYRPEARSVAAHALALSQRLGDAHGEFMAGVAMVRASSGTEPDLPALCAALQALHDAHPAWQPRSSRVLAGTLAVAANAMGDPETALRHRRTELALARQGGFKAAADAAESTIVTMLHNLDRHEESLQASEQLLQRLGSEDSINVAYARYAGLSALVALGLHDAVRARAATDSSLLRRYRMPFCAERWALMLAHEGRYRAALRLVGHGQQVHLDLGCAMSRETCDTRDAVLALCRPHVPATDWNTLMAEGSALDEPGALAWVCRTEPDA